MPAGVCRFWGGTTGCRNGGKRRISTVVTITSKSLQMTADSSIQEVSEMRIVTPGAAVVASVEVPTTALVPLTTSTDIAQSSLTRPAADHIRVRYLSFLLHLD